MGLSSVDVEEWGLAHLPPDAGSGLAVTAGLGRSWPVVLADGAAAGRLREVILDGAELFVAQRGEPVEGARGFWTDVEAAFPRLVAEHLAVYWLAAGEPPWPWRYACNVCGSANETSVLGFAREEVTCGCGSTLRYRATLHALSTELFGACLPLDRFPSRRELRGLGLSNWLGYSSQLAERLDYINTFYRAEPALDITAPPPSWLGTYDFVIAGDVFEHVAPPVVEALANARRLLRSGGFLLLTVPYRFAGPLVEHYPDLFDWEIVTEGDRSRLRNRTRDGVVQEFDDVVFHGRKRSVELRVFSEPSLAAALAAAGFRSVRFCHDPCFGFGISWREARGVPVVARVT